jgi:hypothetical protein
MSEKRNSGPSKNSPRAAQLPLFPADILARVKVWPGSEQARRMTVGSGLRCTVSSLPSGPLGSLVRMLLATSLWASPVCRLTWRVRAMRAGRLIYQLVPLVLSIDETGSLLWRTPHANNWKNPSTMEERIGGFPLTMAILWPTLRASEWKGTGPKGSKSQQYRLKKRYLDGTVVESEPEMSGGKLNPTWIEWLMGFPPGWSDISISEGSRLLAIPSSRSKSTPYLKPSL